MAIKIDKKIVAYKLVSAEDKSKQAESPSAPYVPSFEDLKRPELLHGSTYKLKTPVTEHALYITINDMIVDEDLPTEHRRPFEIFVNSKNMEHYQWMVALTRVMSAVFRKGGDVNFLVDELKSVFEPSGGYFKKGGKFVPSLVAEIGEVVEKHLITIGMMQSVDHGQAAKQMLAEKGAATPAASSASEAAFPGAVKCTKCFAMAARNDGGCLTCTECGYSKCG